MSFFSSYSLSQISGQVRLAHANEYHKSERSYWEIQRPLYLEWDNLTEKWKRQEKEVASAWKSTAFFFFFFPSNNLLRNK